MVNGLYFIVLGFLRALFMCCAGLYWVLLANVSHNVVECE